jgi:hypothetical protein
VATGLGLLRVVSLCRNAATLELMGFVLVAWPDAVLVLVPLLCS